MNLFKHGLLAVVLGLLCTASFAQVPNPDPTAGPFKQFFRDLKEIPKRIKKEVFEFDSLKFGANVFDVDLVDALNLSMKYKYEVEPSYKKGYFTRVDKYRLKVGLTPLDFIDEADLPVYFSVNKEAEIVFIRQFKDKKKAFSKLPVFNAKKVPLTWDRALEHLIPGDFVSIPAKLNLVMGAGLTYVDGGLKLNANAFYVLSGEFEIHVFRLINDRVRMRLVARRGRGGGGKVSAKFAPPLFEVSVIDKLIHKVVKTDFAELGFSAHKGDLYVVDYVFDLKNEDARKSYDQILSSSTKFKQLKILSPFNSDKKLAHKFLSIVTTAEKLAKEDKDLPEDEQRVARVFKGKNTYKQKKLSMHLGMNLFRIGYNKDITENHIVSFEKDDKPNFFYYPTYHTEKNRKWLFGWTRQKIVNSTGVLFNTDALWANKDFSDYIMNGFFRDSRMSKSEQRALFYEVKRLIPKSVLDSMDWGQWSDPYHGRHGRLKRAFFHYQLIVKRKAFEYLVGTSKEKIQKELEKYLSLWGHTLPDVSVYIPTNNGRRKKIRTEIWEKFYYFQLKSMVKRLAIIVSDNPAHTIEERIENLLALRKNHAFRVIGPGLMLGMLKENQVSDSIIFTVRAHSKNLEQFTYQYPKNAEFSKLYKDLQLVNSLLHNGKYDLRHYDIDY